MNGPTAQVIERSRIHFGMGHFGHPGGQAVLLTQISQAAALLHGGRVGLAAAGSPEDARHRGIRRTIRVDMISHGGNVLARIRVGEDHLRDRSRPLDRLLVGYHELNILETRGSQSIPRALDNVPDHLRVGAGNLAVARRRLIEEMDVSRDTPRDLLPVSDRRLYLFGALIETPAAIGAVQFSQPWASPVPVDLAFQRIVVQSQRR